MANTCTHHERTSHYHRRGLRGLYRGHLHRQGTTLEDHLKFNFGMPGPEGYRKALRIMKQAEKFGTRFAYEDVKSVIRDEATGLFTVKTSGQNYEARSIIVATGASARYLG